MAVIYRITNMVNNKYYIGSAESFARREWQHRNDLKRGAHKNPHIQASWNKYGGDAFVFEILEEVPEGKTAFDVENKYLHVHVGLPECYNVNTDAIGMRTGIPMSEATKQQLSANRKGKHAGLEHYRYGQTVSAEVRQKIGDTQRGVAKPERTQEHRRNLSIANTGNQNWLGKKHSEESKLKMSKQVLEATTGRLFPSLTAVLQHYGMKMPTLRRVLLTGKPVSKGQFTGLVFQYVDLPSAT